MQASHVALCGPKILITLSASHGVLCGPGIPPKSTKHAEITQMLMIKQWIPRFWTISNVMWAVLPAFHDGVHPHGEPVPEFGVLSASQEFVIVDAVVLAGEGHNGRFAVLAEDDSDEEVMLEVRACGRRHLQGAIHVAWFPLGSSRRKQEAPDVNRGLQPGYHPDDEFHCCLLRNQGVSSVESN